LHGGIISQIGVIHRNGFEGKQGAKSDGHEAIIRMQSDSKEAPIRTHFKIGQLSTVSAKLSIRAHKIGELNIVAGGLVVTTGG